MGVALFSFPGPSHWTILVLNRYWGSPILGTPQINDQTIFGLASPAP